MTTSDTDQSICPFTVPVAPQATLDELRRRVPTIWRV